MSSHDEIDAVDGAAGLLSTDPDAEADVQLRRSARSRTLTTKGLAYQLEVKTKRREYAFKKAHDLSEHMRSLLTDGTHNRNELQCMFSHWMSLYEQFRDINDDYVELIDEELRKNDQDNWFTKRQISWFLNRKSKPG